LYGRTGQAVADLGIDGRGATGGVDPPHRGGLGAVPPAVPPAGVQGSEPPLGGLGGFAPPKAEA